ncbi:MAG: type II secretion system F family protein [Candidatus Hydrogenedentota bacterium]|nr:MAG: type II secretion system F family protein [Candidatus Hydrogenedentota bacterium]
MPVFSYKAFDSAGKEVKGVIEAANLAMARSKLQQQRLYIREIQEDIAKRDRTLFPFLAKFIYRIPRKDIGLFAKELGTLLGAGISLDEALQDVWEQTSNPNLKKIILDIKNEVISGASLSEGLKNHSDIFPPVYSSMVQVGEATGSYETVLNRLSELEEKNYELKSKAITALIYPSFMFAMSIGVVLFLLTSVVPQIQNMFAKFKGELPLLTRFVIASSEFIRAGWPFLILLLVAALYGLYRYRKSEVGKLKTDELLFRLPLFGKLLKKIQASRFARNFGVLLESNVSLITAMEIVTDTITNEVFRQELKEGLVQIKEGVSIRQALSSSEVLPQMAKGLIAAGESTDKLPQMLIKVADILDREIDTAVKGLTTSLEPVLIVVMGVLVGGIMAAILLPIYQITQYIR